MNFEEILQELSNKFRIRKQETYSYDDVVNIIENEFVHVAAKRLQREGDAISSAKDELQSQLDEFKTKFEEAQKSEEALKAQIAEKEEALKPFQEKELLKTAETLLKGVVVAGAEADAYKLLKDQEGFADLDLSDDSDKEALLAPFVEKVYAAKPYMKPVVAEEQSDDEEIVKKSVGAKEEAHKVPSFL